MIEYRLGYFARSLCGHDKDRLYMIVSEDGEMVGLCDGVHRRLANPKMKKKKHIQMMRSEKMAEAFPALIQSADADAKIKKAVLAAGERR
ncbi:MAG: KOW domain-containing RNA-binding protein [Clostridiales bacterium]|nr:KOW domain-containing RNA-binding protein [Clostridiales bacterium]